MFYQSHSLALHAVEIFCNLILKNIITLDYEKSWAALPSSDYLFDKCDLDSKK